MVGLLETTVGSERQANEEAVRGMPVPGNEGLITGNSGDEVTGAGKGL